MIIENMFGKYEVIVDYREGYNQEQFESRYVPETFDKFNYIVGDVSSEMLRLKGFSENKRSVHFFERIPEYLLESCNPNCAHFVLKRIRE